MSGHYTILIVEDNNLLRELLHRYLDQNYNVMVAADGQAGVTILRYYAGTLDLLLTDVSLPDMNGWDLIRQSRSLRPDMKWLIMSGDRSRLSQDGPDDAAHRCLLKPFQLSELQVLLDRTLDPPRGAPGQMGDAVAPSQT